MYVIGRLEPDLKGFDGTDKEVHDKFEYLVEKFEKGHNKRSIQSVGVELIHETILKIEKLAA
jgi:hypothetical protein